MKVVTNGYKNNIKLMGKELDSKITYTINGVETELGSEELNSVTPHYKADILKSVMKQLDIDSNVDIPLNTVINYQFGVKVGNSYEYINYGNYVVIKSEKNEDTNSYQLTCYDKMLYAMKNYEDIGVTYPITIRSYINALATYLGLTFKNASDTFVNYNRIVAEELFLNPDGEGIGYTFRDVLDELAEVTASIICINENDDELELRYPTNSGITLDEEWFSDVNVKFSNIAGPFNTVVLTRGDGTDKISQSIPSNLPDEDKIAIVIEENQFMNENDRSDYIPDILNQINGLTYSICDYSSPGITFLELGDKYNASINNVSYPCLMLGDDVQITQGLKENVETEEPNTYQEDYAYVEPTDKAIREAGIKIDKKIAEVDIRGKTINLTADDINITSTNFTVDDTGRITATSGNIAGFEMSDGFSYEIKAKKDYNQTDVDKLTAYIYSGGSLTDEEKELYDVNGDGDLTLNDIMMMVWMINNNIGNTYPATYKIQVPQGSAIPSSIRNTSIGLFDGFNNLISGFTWTKANFPELTINDDKIVESGSNTNGNYVKFYDGTAICSMSYDVTLANSWSTWGGLYSSSYIELPDYPINFVAEPTTNVTFQRIQGSYNGWLIPHEYANPSISNPGTYQFLRPTNPNASFPIRICIIAVGKWK